MQSTDTNSNGYRWLRIVLAPLFILAGALLLALFIAQQRPEAKASKYANPPLLVTTTEISARDISPVIPSHGVVRPHTQTRLVSEVSGVVQWVHPSLVTGGFLSAGETIIRVDPRQYEAALAQARATLAEARSQAASEAALANYAAEDWQRLIAVDAASGEASELTLRKPQLEAALAKVRAAQAGLLKAREDLDRTRVRAPYAAVVAQRLAQLGQFLTPGAELAELYAADYAEIRLPVAANDWAFLNLAALRENSQPIPVQLIAHQRRIEALITRSEALLDENAQVLHLVARVDDPYQFLARGDMRAGKSSEAPAVAGPGATLSEPLHFGTFVAAHIQGRTLRDVYSVPRYAVDGEQIWTVTAEQTLEPLPASILRREQERVFLRTGPTAEPYRTDGSITLCLTPGDNPRSGQSVRARNESSDSAKDPNTS